MNCFRTCAGCSLNTWKIKKWIEEVRLGILILIKQAQSSISSNVPGSIVCNGLLLISIYLYSRGLRSFSTNDDDDVGKKLKSSRESDVILLPLKRAFWSRLNRDISLGILVSWFTCKLILRVIFWLTSDDRKALSMRLTCWSSKFRPMHKSHVPRNTTSLVEFSFLLLRISMSLQTQGLIIQRMDWVQPNSSIGGLLAVIGDATAPGDNICCWCWCVILSGDSDCCP